MNENEEIILSGAENFVIRNFQWELADNLFAETQVDPDQFTQWEFKFIENCYSELKMKGEDFVLNQNQQEKLEEISLKVWGDD